MSGEGWVAVITLAAVGALAGVLMLVDRHIESSKCHRAGDALHKTAEYSYIYGCFLDGVPSEMIREINP